jgi:hypothetical protein
VPSSPSNVSTTNAIVAVRSMRSRPRHRKWSAA